MPKNDPEYKALERVVTADKRFRKFMYTLALCVAVFFIGFLVLLANRSVAEVRADNRQSAEDSRVVAKETIRYITCMFVIPIEKRTPAIQEKCFKAADLPGGLKRSDFSPIVIPNVNDATDTTATQAVIFPTSFSSSSPNSAPQKQSSQSNTSQPSSNKKSGGSDKPQPEQPKIITCSVDLFIIQGECPL